MRRNTRQQGLVPTQRAHHLGTVVLFIRLAAAIPKEAGQRVKRSMLPASRPGRSMQSRRFNILKSGCEIRKRSELLNWQCRHSAHTSLVLAGSQTSKLITYRDPNMEDNERCCGSGTCIIDAQGRCWCGQQWDGEKMCWTSQGGTPFSTPKCAAQPESKTP